MIEEVAETFDMLPRIDRVSANGDERESAARIFNAAGRAELWSAGNGDYESAPVVTTEFGHREQSHLTIEDLGSAFSLSGLARDNNGTSL